MFGFEPIWFIGVIEDRTDPLKVGRCKVRCLGFHQQDINELPTENLPWAQLLIPTNSQNEIKPPKEGSWVLGFFKDGKKCQEPMVISLIPGIPTISPEQKKSKGFYLTSVHYIMCPLMEGCFCQMICLFVSLVSV